MPLDKDTSHARRPRSNTINKPLPKIPVRCKGCGASGTAAVNGRCVLCGIVLRGLGIEWPQRSSLEHRLLRTAHVRRFADLERPFSLNVPSTVGLGTMLLDAVAVLAA